MRTDPQFAVADVLRKVVRQLDSQLNSGCRNRRIDAEDLLQTLLSVPDELDPPMPHVASGKPSSA